jgi:hypothetical protein
MNKRILLVILLLLTAVASRVQSGPEEARRLYRMSLDAYLVGKYDPAILLAAQALQEDPGSKKTKGLLTVLIGEKERMAKSEIWIASSPKPRVKPSGSKKDKDFMWNELQTIRMELRSVKDEQRRNSAKELMRRFEQRVQVVATILEKASADQIEELRKNQADTHDELDAMRSGGLAVMAVLAGLSIASLVFSVAAYRRRGRAHPPRPAP